MPDSNAEDAAHAHANALVDGDHAAAFLGMTPDGLASAMEIGSATWNIMGYELGEGRQDGDDFLVDIFYLTDIGRLELHYRFRNIDGRWKVEGIERVT